MVVEKSQGGCLGRSSKTQVDSAAENILEEEAAITAELENKNDRDNAFSSSASLFCLSFSGAHPPTPPWFNQ